MSDRTIRQDVIAALERLNLDWAVAVAVEAGIVTLFGRTPNGAQRLAAEVASCRTPGVRAVLNKIEVRAAPDPDARIGDVAANALAAVKELAGASIGVSVTNGVPTLHGEAPDERRRILAEQELLRLSDIGDVRNLIHVAMPSGDPASQLLTLMRREGAETHGVQVGLHDGAVELSGQAAGWFDRDAAERLAWTLPGVHAVTNRIALPEGAAQPDGDEGAPA